MRTAAGPISTIALLVALLPAAGAAQHQHHHPDPKAAAKAPAKPAAKPKATTTATATPASRRTTSSAAGDVERTGQHFEQNGVAVHFNVTPMRRTPSDSAADTSAAGHVRENENAVVRLALSDAKTGKPLAGQAPAAWIDRRGSPQLTDAPACKVKVDKYVQASTNMEQSLKARAEVDLNSYYVLTLNKNSNISVIDPFLGFGRTKLYTTVLLKSEGEDWKLSNDQDRLYVTMPRVGQLAVVNTDSWKVMSNVDAGPRPTKVALQPDERYVWVTNPGVDSAAANGDTALMRGGVTVIDRTTLEAKALIRTGREPNALAFSGDSRFAFVLDRKDGTLSIIDVEKVTKVKSIKLGPQPVDLAYSPVSDAVYVIDDRDGTVAVVDVKRLALVKLLKLEPGVRTIRFAPMTGSGHGAHMAHAGHGTDSTSAAGRIGFVLNPRRNTVTILDASKNVVMRTTEMGEEPDQIGFTTSFAYIRSAGSPDVAMIPLADPSAGGTGHLDKFPAGGAAPRGAGQLSDADAIVAAPDMPDAVYVMNPKERMVYYFHYMEGMPIPSGGLTTYGFDPKAVLVAGKDLRETEPGVYEATIRLTNQGDYDFIFLLDDPRVVHCFDLPVAANRELRKGRLSVSITPLAARRQLTVGADNVLRFKIADLYTREPKSELKDAEFVLTATNGWRQRALMRSLGDGIYEMTVKVPASGVYYMSFEIPSIGVKGNDRSPVIWRALVGSR